MKMFANFVLALMLTLAGCGAARGRGDTETRAQVRFLLEPDNARVYSDGHYVGSGQALAAGVSFPVGQRQFMIVADGYFPHDLSLALPAGESTIHARLRAVPQ